MKKYLFIVVLVTSLIVLGTGASGALSGIVDSMEFQGEGIELTLDQAIQIALQDNATIKQTKLDFEQTKMQYEKTKSTLRQTRLANSNVKKDSGQYILAVTFPELTNEYTLDQAKRNMEAVEKGLKADIEQSYYSLLHAEQSLEINKESLEAAKELYEITKQKFELGLVSEQDVLSSELSYIRSQNTYNSAVNALKTAKMQFNIKMRYDIMTEVKLKDEMKYYEFEMGSIADAVNQALANRMEIKSAEYSYEKEKINMEITARQYPDITYQYKEQKLKEEKVFESLEMTRKNIEMEVRRNYMDVLQKKKEINSSEKSVELSQQALQINRTLYDVQMVKLSDAEKAETSLQQAKLSLSKAILDYNLAVMKFNDCLGVGRK